MIRSKIFWFLLLVSFATGCEKNQPPVCQLAVTPQEGTLHTHFLFTAESCSDAENPVYSLKFRWDLNGDGEWETDFNYDREIIWKYMVAGIYTVRAEAIDPLGKSVILQNLVVVNDENETPLPYLKLSMKKTSLSGSVVLDGSLSWDYEDHIDFLRFRWDFNSDGIWDTDFGSSVTCSHVFDLPGQSTITMEVIDTDSASAKASKTIQVINTANLYSCLLDPRNNHEYPIVLIGNRWWMAENLDYGELKSSGGFPSDNNIPEMFVYQDQSSNRKLYGGLYCWPEAVNYDSTEPAKGVCPEGWHIPGDSEWMELESALGLLPDMLESVSPDRGDPAGTYLKTDGQSGFEAGLFGLLTANQGFFGLDAETGFWSSTQSGSCVWVRTVRRFSGGIQRSVQAKDYAFYVRCIKDE